MTAEAQGVSVALSAMRCLQVPMHQNFDNFYLLCERLQKPKKKAFYRLLMSVSFPEIRAFKVLEILRKNAKGKLCIS